MALTQGNVTIKLSGGDYSSWAGFWDDLGDLTGDITCTVDASAFTENTAPAAVTESLNGYTLHILPTSFPTTTDTTTGARFTCNYTGLFLSMQMEGPGAVIIEGITAKPGTSEFQTVMNLSSIDTEFNFTFRRNILKGGTSRGFTFSDSTMNSNTKIYNNIFIESDYGSLHVITAMPDAIFANNTLVRSGYSGVKADNNNVVFKNILSYGSNNYDFVDISSNTSGYNNASSDLTAADSNWGGTGSDNLTSISDPFTDYTNNDFTIVADHAIESAGLDLSDEFTDDFFGLTRRNWTIGAIDAITSYNPILPATATIGLSVSVISSITEASEREIKFELTGKDFNSSALRLASDISIYLMPKALSIVTLPVSAVYTASAWSNVALLQSAIRNIMNRAWHGVDANARGKFAIDLAYEIDKWFMLTANQAVTSVVIPGVPPVVVMGPATPNTGNAAKDKLQKDLISVFKNVDAKSAMTSDQSKKAINDAIQNYFNAFELGGEQIWTLSPTLGYFS